MTFKSASREVAKVEEMFRYHKDALVGLPTGKTNDLLVLDIDETETISGEDTLVKVGISLTDSWQVRTPRGGRHIYFKYPTNAKKIPNKAGFNWARDRSE